MDSNDIGLQVPRVCLPRPGTDLARWAVIACDQFTSQPEYWQEVERIVGEAPSTLHLILPEVRLGQPDEPARIARIQATMRRYLADGTLEPRAGMIHVERRVGGRVRHGIVVALDLEHYDYTKHSTSLVRATEGTIVERLPPRMRIREGAVLELPHILVLIDDRERRIIEPLADERPRMERLYDVELMLGSGHLTGRALTREQESRVVEGLRGLAAADAFAARYGVGRDTPPLLYAVGDGNHSLATAKAVWEGLKPRVGPEHPSRYALVEIENVHDAGLEFEPIHRVLFGLRSDLRVALSREFAERLRYEAVADAAAMSQAVGHGGGSAHVLGLVGEGGHCGVLRIEDPRFNLPVGTLQAFLDRFLDEGGAERVDYVHGDDVVLQLGSQRGNAGFLLPGMDKSELFRTVVLDGALPRKTFSMGEAREKRFYMEARVIAG